MVGTAQRHSSSSTRRTPRPARAGPARLAALLATLFVSAGCGRTSSVDLSKFDPGQGGRKVGGAVQGLAGAGLVLRNLGGDDLAIAANGLFSFPARMSPGAVYQITVAAQPKGPAQTCTVRGGQGAVGSADVLDVFVGCVTAVPVTLGGPITGLAGTGLLLQQSGGDDLPVAAGSTSFAFATQLPTGAEYAITIKKQPVSPLQVCRLESANGTAGQGIPSIACSTNPAFAVGGSITGLVGAGLVLQDNRGDDLRLPVGAASFSFATPVQKGARYSVTVRTQPSAPPQTCTVAPATASGTVGDGPVTTVNVACTTRLFAVGGTVSGLLGGGLVLRNDGGDDLSALADGGFAFPTGLPGGSSYSVSIARQPSSPSQTCTVSASSGVLVDGDVTDVAIDCVTDPFFAISGTVTGLSGQGLVLRDQTGEALAIGGDGGFVFSTGLQTGEPYSVAVAAQPSGPLQTCTVARGTGVVAIADVADVAVTCATIPSFAIGGTVSGLLGESLVLRLLGGDSLPVAANGAFTFLTRLQGTQPYSVTVRTPPFAPHQVCAVEGGEGTVGSGDVTTVRVTCTVAPAHTIGGTVLGLHGGGLVLQQDGFDDLPLAAGGSFAFAIPLQETAPYLVTVKSQPQTPRQTCTVAGAGGLVGAADVVSVVVTCADNPSFKLGGVVTGLPGAGLVLHGPAGDAAVAANGPFSFPQRLQQGQGYRISVTGQPAGQTCAVTGGGEGTMGAADAGTIAVTCGAGPFVRLIAQVTGLAGQGLVLSSNGDDLTVAADGAATFADQLVPGQTFALAVKAQPAGPQQTCTVGPGASGAAGTSDLAVAVTCTTNPFFNLGGVVTGLSGSGLLLANGSDLIPLTANGTFTFATQLQSGARYQVAVLVQPSSPLQTCAVIDGAGAMGTGNVTNVFVNCQANPYFTIGGFVRCLTATGMVLQEGGTNDIAAITPVAACDAPATFFIFPTLLQASQAYSVSVKQQPTSKPTQTCTVSRGSGTVVRTVSNVSVACAADPAYTVGGTVTGLAGAGLTLLLNNATGTPLPVAQDGTFTFATPVQTLQPYAVTVQAQPGGPAQSCRVVNPSGTMGAGAVTSVAVICTVSNFTIGGFVTGLPAGATVTLQDNGFDNRTVTGTGVTPLAFSFGVQVASGRGWSAALVSSTGPVSCALSGGATGVVTSAATTAVQVGCIPAFSIGGTVAGYAGSGLQLANASSGETLTVAKGAAAFALARPVAQAQGYAVSVAAQPSLPAQTCAFAASPSSSGNPAANVTDLALACTTNSYPVGGLVSGLPAGASVTLLDNGGDAAPVAGAGDGSAPMPFSFPTQVASGLPFAATLTTSAGPVACAVQAAGASGTVTGAPITSIQVNCVPTFSIAGTLLGYAAGTTGPLQLKNGPTNETITVPSGQTTFAFTKPVTRAQGYAITVAVQPTGPSQACGVSGATPTPAAGSPAANVSDLALVCNTSMFAVSGSIAGLPLGASVTLLNNGANSLTVSGLAGTPARPVAFAPVPSAGAYEISVSASTGPVSCAVSAGGSGTIGGAAVTNLLVTCTPAFSVAGTIAGYAGSGLQLGNAATGEVLTLAKGATTFAFARLVTQAQGYAIAVTAQPVLPVQACAVSGATPTPASGNPSANVTGIAFSCATSAFPVGGTVTGLPAGAAVTLLNAGVDATVVDGAGDGSAPASFSFVTPVKSGATWAATVQGTSGFALCTLASGGSGTVAGAPVTSVLVTCSPAFLASGTVAGYQGTGLQLRNSVTNETITTAAGQTAFSFNKLFTQKQGYSVAVVAQPTGPTQSCAILPSSPAAPAGFPSANVTNLVVTCTVSAFSIGGKVTGLPTGTSVTLQDNGIDTLKINGSGDGSAAINFNFGTQVFSGQPYSAALLSSTGAVSCALTGSAAGAVAGAAIATLLVACAPAFTVAGTLSGYLGAGLSLQNTTTGEVVVVPQGQGTFAFKRPVSTAQGYALVVQTPPVNPSQACAPASASPSPATGNPAVNLTDIAFACTSNTFSIGGLVYRLATGTSLTLQDLGGDDLVVWAGAPSYPRFTFATRIASGQAFTVTVKTQPPGQLCAVRAGTGGGLIGALDVKTVAIDCAATRSLGGKVRGYVGSGLALSDGAESLPIPSAAGAEVPFTFPTKLAQGSAWQVSVLAQPGSPAQPCAVSGGGNGDGSGTLGATDEASVVVTCGTPAWRVGGTIVGLATGQSSAAVLTDNGADPLLLGSNASSTSNGVPFHFPAPVTQGQPYSVAVLTPPAGLACRVTAGSGVVGPGDVTSVRVLCGFPVSGAFDTALVSGTAGQLPSEGLALQDSVAWAPDGWADTEVHAIPRGAATFTLADPVPRGGTCALSVPAQPRGPAQLCTVSATAGCNGGVVSGPIAAQVRCVQQVDLISFAGATGALLTVAADATNDLVAGGNFLGSSDLGHGARAGSTFSAAGSGLLLGLDPAGSRGSAASPLAASWDFLFPAAGAAANAGSAKVRAAAVLASGDVLLGGSYSGSVDFGDGTGAAAAPVSESMFLARIAPPATVVWARRFGAGAITSLAAGARLVAGGIYGAAPGAEEKFGGACALTAASAHRDFVAAFDLAAGGCAFALDLGAGQDLAGTSPRLGPAVALDSTGNLIAAGNSTDNSGLTALAGPWLATWDSTGKSPCFTGGAAHELFRDAANPGNDLVTGLAVGSGDALLVTGYCQGSPKVMNVARSCSTAASSAFVARYSARAACVSGQLVGPVAGAPQLVISSAGSAKGLAIATDGAGNVLLSGLYSGTPSLAGSVLFAGPAPEAQNAFAARFPAALTAPIVQAVNSTGPFSITGVTSGAGGSLWVSGAYSGAVSYKGRTPALGSTAAAAEPMLLHFPQGPP